MVDVGQCTLKVPNGKMLKVTVEFQDESIETVHIRGDFFIHPEECLDDLEMALKGSDYSKSNVSDIVGQFFGGHDIIAFGITPKAVTEAVMKCREAAL